MVEISGSCVILLASQNYAIVKLVRVKHFAIFKDSRYVAIYFLNKKEDKNHLPP